MASPPLPFNLTILVTLRIMLTIPTRLLNPRLLREQHLKWIALLTLSALSLGPRLFTSTPTNADPFALPPFMTFTPLQWVKTHEKLLRTPKLLKCPHRRLVLKTPELTQEVPTLSPIPLLPKCRPVIPLSLQKVLL